jgi:hypothetical protein
MKAKRWGKKVIFHCPGCNERHVLPLDGPEAWTFNGDTERPTLSPSVMLPGVCHSFVTDGRIQFLNDCTHALAGQTVDLPEVES